MNSAWAMLVCWMAWKNIVMFSPKNTATGIIIRHVARPGAGCPVRAQRTPMITHQATADRNSRQNATAAPLVSDHLTSEELLEKQSTPASTARIPRTRRSLVSADTSFRMPGDGGR